MRIAKDLRLFQSCLAKRKQPGGRSRRAVRFNRFGSRGGKEFLRRADSSGRHATPPGTNLNPLDKREVWHIAKSVGKWTWRNMSLGGWRRWVVMTYASEVQARRGRKGDVASGVVRRAGSVEESKPWEAEGICRRTWYSRKSGLLVPGEA